MKVIDAHAHIFERAGGYPDGFTAPRLLEVMDAAGVGRAVLLQNPTFGSINDYVRRAVEQYPGRFVATIQVDPTSADAAGQTSRYAAPGQNTLKIEMSEGWGWSGKYPGISLTDGCFDKIWDTVTHLGLRVIIDPGPVFNNGYQVENIAALAARYPSTLFLIEHLGYMTAEDYGEKAMARWHEMIALGRDHANVYFGTSAAGSLTEEDYPCPRSQELFKEAARVMGAGKLLWGSDIPTTLQKYTYLQMVDLVNKESPFLSETEKEMVLSGNAERFFGF